MLVFTPPTLQSDGLFGVIPQKHSVNEQIKMVQPVHLTWDLFLEPYLFFCT